MKWKYGECGGKYSKFILFASKFFDIELLKCEENEYIKPHVDIGNGRIYKALFNIKKPSRGGGFYSSSYIFNCGRMKIYRADKYEHGVDIVITGKRIDFVLGFKVL